MKNIDGQPRVSDWPELHAQWHPTLNPSHSPEDLVPGSNTLIWWQCELGHAWKASPVNRTKKGTLTRCRVCIDKQVHAGYNDFATIRPELVEEWDADNLTSPYHTVAKSQQPVRWTCKQGHRWSAAPKNRLTTYGCAYCAGVKAIPGETDLATTHPLLAAEWHPELNATKTVNDVKAGSSGIAWWLCPQGHSWKTSPLQRTSRGVNCKVCSNLEVLTGYNDLATTHPHLAASWHPTKNGDSTATATRGNERALAWWQCAEGHEWSQSPAVRTTLHSGCPVCVNRAVIVGVNDLLTTHPELVAELTAGSEVNSWNPRDLTAGSSLLASWTCSTCSYEWQVPIRARASENAGCTPCARKVVGRKNRTPAVGESAADLNPELVKEWHPTLNGSQTLFDYKPSSSTVVWWQCARRHTWLAQVGGRTRTDGKAHGCGKCSNNGTSRAEQELSAWVQELIPDKEVRNHARIPGSQMQLDIFVPEHRFAIEYNGLYWHSDARGKSRTYHQQKWQACKSQGIELLYVWEDDWHRNPEQVRRMVAEALGTTIPGELVTLDSTKVRVRVSAAVEAEHFLHAYSMMAPVQGTHHLSLVSDSEEEEVLAMLVFEWEDASRTLTVLHYASSTLVDGGFATLLEHAQQMVEPLLVVGFTQNGGGRETLYQEHGFHEDGAVELDYTYLVRGKRQAKTLCPVSGLQEAVREEKLPTQEPMGLDGFPRIWDAGKIRWVKPVQP